MNERWTTVDRLFEAALDRAPDDRAAFLREACPDDEALRQEVEALLTHATSAGDFLERPALELLGSVLVEGDSPSLLGRQLGPHRILSLLAIGGMGEVYRARDTRLDRDVAIKVLPEQLALDPDRLARLKREAQVLASLNHPQHRGDLRVRRSRWRAGAQSLSWSRVRRSPIGLLEDAFHSTKRCLWRDR